LASTISNRSKPTATPAQLGKPFLSALIK